VILPLHKPAGWTPLEALEALRACTPALAGEPMVYAGRLDPMAEGVLLVLTGADRFDLPAHLAHDKQYVATILFGVRSDTYDALGRITRGGDPDPARCLAAVAALGGTHVLPLPAWSAYRVRGRPLHAWASEGRIAEIEVPTREMRVTAVDGAAALSTRIPTFFADVHARIDRVRGTFRQAEALADWARLRDADPPLVTVTATLTVTSGTYVRALAEDVGARLGVGGLLLALRRTRVGPYGAETAPTA
jgi:tRNA pseudouridine55 synthase